MDIIPFTEFSTTGVSAEDTFNDWRLKTNGITEQLGSVSAVVDALHNGSNITYVTINTDQTLLSSKTFGAGSSSAPMLKVGSSGLYYEDATLKITTPIQANVLIAASTLKLGSTAYAVPAPPPISNAYLTGNANTGALSWTTESSIIQAVQTAVSNVPVGILNQIIPIGTISAFSGVAAPTSWLQCTGALILGATYPDLCQLLGTLYGPVCTNSGGTVFANKGATYSWNAVTSLTHYFTIPNLYGRGIVGVGTGTDGTYSSTFTAGQTGGSYKYLLTSAELPSHSHGVGSLLITAGGSHSHTFNGDPSLGITTGGTGTTSYKTSTLFPTSTSTAADHTHTITGVTASTGSGVAFSILQPFLSTIYVIKALPDSVINTIITSGDGIQFSSGSVIPSFNIKDSGTYTVSVKHNSTLTVSGAELGLADNSVTAAKIPDATLTPAKLAAVSGGTISWDATYAYHKALPLATQAYVDSKSFRKGNVQQLREKTFGDTSAISWRDYAYVNDDDNVVVTGHNRYSIFGACNAFGHQVMPLPLNRKVSKLYMSEYSMACIDTTGQLWAIGRNTNNQFNIASGSVADLTTWTQAFPQIVNPITKIVLSSYTTYVIDNANNLWSAGYNGYGQLGNGTTTNTSSIGYQTVLTKANILDVVVCGSETSISACALCTDNQIYTCGYGGYGQIGIGTANNSSTWTAITKPLGVTSWSGYKLYNKGYAGQGGFVVINSAGTAAYAWGYNGDYSFGLGITSAVIMTPVNIWPYGVGAGTISKFYTTFGEGVIYVLTSDNKIFASGNNSYGNFANNSTSSSNTWLELTSYIPSGYTLEDLYVSNSNSTRCSIIIKCYNAILDKRFLFGAGDNLHGQLGNAKTVIPSTSFTPVLIDSTLVAEINDVQITYNNSTGAYALILLDDGQLYWAGFNEYNFDSGIESSWNSGQVRTMFNRIK